MSNTAKTESYLALKSSPAAQTHPDFLAWLLIITLSALTILPGCGIPAGERLTDDSYYLNPAKDLRSIGRVALVELDNESRYPQASTDVTEALFLTLQKSQLFGLTVIQQNNPDWRSLQSNLTSTSPLQQLSAIRQTLKCDALLIGTLTEYQPYPHLAVGLRLKLLDLTDGQLLWGLEQIWDSADRSTENRIKRYFRSEMRTDQTLLREQLIVISSIKFIKFIAYEVAQTMQPRRSRTPAFYPKVP
jgi:hypothetical protein